MCKSTSYHFDSNGTSKKFNTLGPCDIIIGRGRKYENNLGNKMFRDIMRRNLEQYMGAPTRQDKSILSLSLFHMLREDMAARFVKPLGDGLFEESEPQEARNKVAHALRDLASKHSNHSKKSDRATCAHRDSEVRHSRCSVTPHETLHVVIPQTISSSVVNAHGERQEDDPLNRWIGRFFESVDESDADHSMKEEEKAVPILCSSNNGIGLDEIALLTDTQILPCGEDVWSNIHSSPLSLFL